MEVVRISSSVAALLKEYPAMTSYLAYLQKGRKATPHSWLYEDEPSDVTLERWLRILKAHASENSLSERLVQFDLAQVSKFGPQGKVPPLSSDAAQAVLEPLFSPSAFDDENALSEWFGVTKAFAKVLFGRLGTERPRAIAKLRLDMIKRNTLISKSGFPRNAVRSTVWEEEKRDAETGKAWHYPATLVFRQYNGKLRPVWMYPMSMNLLEMQYSTVIQDRIRASSSTEVQCYFSPWEGFNAVKEQLTEHWGGTSSIVGGDTTKMDAHMRRAQIRLVFEIVKWLFQESYWDKLYKVMMQITTIPLLVSDSQWILGPHGLASGSGWTQLVESILTAFMNWVKAGRLCGSGVGDDFVWFLKMTADEVVAWLARFGLPANAAKQSVGVQEVTFLQRLFDVGLPSREDPKIMGAYYPTIRALNSLLNPERFHTSDQWNWKMFACREIMITENTVDDPWFVEFVTMVSKGNSHLKEFAKQSDAEIQEAQIAASKIPGLYPSYNQEKREKPLASFETVKVLRALH